MNVIEDIVSINAITGGTYSPSSEVRIDDFEMAELYIWNDDPDYSLYFGANPSFENYYNKILSTPFPSARDLTFDNAFYHVSDSRMDRQFLGYFLLSSSYNALPARCSTVYTCGYAECYEFEKEGDYWSTFDTIYQGGADVTLWSKITPVNSVCESKYNIETVHPNGAFYSGSVLSYTVQHNA